MSKSIMPFLSAEQASETLLVMKRDYDLRGVAGYITVYTGNENNQINIQLGSQKQGMDRNIVTLQHKGAPTIFMGARLVGSWPESLLPVLLASEVLAYERELHNAGHVERTVVAKEYGLLDEMIVYFEKLLSITKDVNECRFISLQLGEFRKAL